MSYRTHNVHIKLQYFKYIVISTSLVLGWVFWLVESAVESLFFYEATFMERAFTDVPDYEIYIRSVVMVFFMLSSLVMLRLMSQRRKAEQSLEEEKEKLSVTIRSIGDGVITTDTEGTVILMNNIAEDLTGWPLKEANGKPFKEIFHIIDEQTGTRADDPVEKVLTAKRIIGLGTGIILKSLRGKEYAISDTAAPIRDRDKRIIGVVVVFSDITAKRSIEKEINKSEKLKAVGILAGGIAHDFNNIMTASIGNISIALRQAEETGSEDIIEPLRDAHESLKSAKGLTGQLLTFSKGGAPVKKKADAGEFIQEIITSIPHESRITIEADIPENIWPVHIDKGQIGTALRNVLANAAQAMPEGGDIRISAENIKAGSVQSMPLEHGRYVKISISDTGIGIPGEYLSRIFDPYFTTKQEGNGLGLATAYSIVRKHEGFIDAESVLGKSTCVSIYLPSHEEDGVSGERPTEFVEKEVSADGKILLMDDEEFVRKVGTRILNAFGFDVETAVDGKQTIEKYSQARETGAPFDAVILDLTIPGGVGGRETIQELMKIHAGVKAIVSSGYSTDPVMSEYKKYGFSGCIQKPYEIEELRSVLDHVLLSR